MGSPNQFVTPKDKAKGYPFAIRCEPPKTGQLNGATLRKALVRHGVEDLQQIMEMSFRMPPDIRRVVVVWGYGRATISGPDLTGFPKMPVWGIKSYLRYGKSVG